MLKRQQQFVNKLQQLCYSIVKNTSDSRESKIQVVKNYLGTIMNDAEWKEIFDDKQQALCLPLNTNIEVIGIEPESAYIFKSSNQPLMLTLKTKTGPFSVSCSVHSDICRLFSK